MAESGEVKVKAKIEVDDSDLREAQERQRRAAEEMNQAFEGAPESEAPPYEEQRQPEEERQPGADQRQPEAEYETPTDEIISRKEALLNELRKVNEMEALIKKGIKGDADSLKDIIKYKGEDAIENIDSLLESTQKQKEDLLIALGVKKPPQEAIPQPPQEAIPHSPSSEEEKEERVARKHAEALIAATLRQGIHGTSGIMGAFGGPNIPGLAGAVGSIASGDVMGGIMALGAAGWGLAAMQAGKFSSASGERIEAERELQYRDTANADKLSQLLIDRYATFGRDYGLSHVEFAQGMLELSQSLPYSNYELARTEKGRILATRGGLGFPSEAATQLAMLRGVPQFDEDRAIEESNLMWSAGRQNDPYTWTQQRIGMESMLQNILKSDLTGAQTDRLAAIQGGISQVSDFGARNATQIMGALQQGAMGGDDRKTAFFMRAYARTGQPQDRRSFLLWRSRAMIDSMEIIKALAREEAGEQWDVYLYDLGIINDLQMAKFIDPEMTEHESRDEAMRASGMAISIGGESIELKPTDFFSKYVQGSAQMISDAEKESTMQQSEKPQTLKTWFSKLSAAWTKSDWGEIGRLTFGEHFFESPSEFKYTDPNFKFLGALSMNPSAYAGPKQNLSGSDSVQITNNAQKTLSVKVFVEDNEQKPFTKNQMQLMGINQ